MSSAITQANHHPTIVDFLSYRRVLIDNSLAERRWDDALGQINESLQGMGNWYLGCRQCQALRAPLLREKSLCTLMLGDLGESERLLFIYECFMEYIKKYEEVYGAGDEDEDEEVGS